MELQYVQFQINELDYEFAKLFQLKILGESACLTEIARLPDRDSSTPLVKTIAKNAGIAHGAKNK